MARAVCSPTGNVGNLPLVIVATLAESSASILHGIDPKQASQLALSYVVVPLLIAVSVHATLGYYMLAPQAPAPAAQGLEAAVQASAPDPDPPDPPGTGPPAHPDLLGGPAHGSRISLGDWAEPHEGEAGAAGEAHLVKWRLLVEGGGCEDRGPGSLELHTLGGEEAMSGSAVATEPLALGSGSEAGSAHTPQCAHAAVDMQATVCDEVPPPPPQQQPRPPARPVHRLGNVSFRNPPEPPLPGLRIAPEPAPGPGSGLVLDPRGPPWAAAASSSSTGRSTSERSGSELCTSGMAASDRSRSESELLEVVSNGSTSDLTAIVPPLSLDSRHHDAATATYEDSKGWGVEAYPTSPTTLPHPRHRFASLLGSLHRWLGRVTGSRGGGEGHGHEEMQDLLAAPAGSVGSSMGAEEGRHGGGGSAAAPLWAVPSTSGDSPRCSSWLIDGSEGSAGAGGGRSHSMSRRRLAHVPLTRQADSFTSPPSLLDRIHGYSFSLRSDLLPVGGPSLSRNVGSGRAGGHGCGRQATSSEGARPGPAPRAEARGVRVRDIVRIVMRESTSPPILACLLSVPVGCIKPLQVGR